MDRRAPARWNSPAGPAALAGPRRARTRSPNSNRASCTWTWTASWPPAFIQHLTEQTVESERFLYPAPALPDQVGIAWQHASWNRPPLKPYLKAKRVFLIDARAISQAGTDLDLVEYYKLADFVGEATAGTTGNINPFVLPGGLRVVYTGMKVLKRDYARFHGVGIQPAIPVSRTRRGIADGVDEILARGLAAVKAR
ncbi:MAG: S41 family peptidase [Acidobacteriota bacterium]